MEKKNDLIWCQRSAEHEEKKICLIYFNCRVILEKHLKSIIFQHLRPICILQGVTKMTKLSSQQRFVYPALKRIHIKDFLCYGAVSVLLTGLFLWLLNVTLSLQNFWFISISRIACRMAWGNSRIRSVTPTTGILIISFTADPGCQDVPSSQKGIVENWSWRFANC